MSSNNSSLLPQHNFNNEKIFPSFDTLILTAPKSKHIDNIEESRINAFKNQMLEEKIKLLETKKTMLESINRNMFRNVNDKNVPYELNHVNNTNLIYYLNDIKRDITDKIGKYYKNLLEQLVNRL